MNLGNTTITLNPRRPPHGGTRFEQDFYCGLILAARTTLPHFSVSAARCLPNSTRDVGYGTEPIWTIFALRPGSARPALISVLSLSRISGGVAAGAPMPYHALAS